jgi:hypothetical protein
MKLNRDAEREADLLGLECPEFLRQSNRQRSRGRATQLFSTVREI